MEPTTSTVSTDPQPMQTRSAKKRKANKPTCECCDEGMFMYELELPAKASKSLLKMMRKNPSKDPVEIKIPPHLLRKAKYIMHDDDDDDDDLDSAKKSKVDGQNKEKSMSYKEFVKHIQESCAGKADPHAERDSCMTDYLKAQLFTVEHNSNSDCCDCDKKEGQPISGESDSNSGGSNSGSDESDSGSDSESDSSSGITSNTSSEESDKE